MSSRNRTWITVSVGVLALIAGSAQGFAADKVIGLLLPDNASSRYENFDKPLFEAAVAKVRRTPLDSPDYRSVLQAATRAGLKSKALIFTYSQPNLIAKSKQVSDLPRNPAHIDWTGVTISGN